MLSGFDGLWYNNFSSNASGLAKTFSPAVTGIAAVFESLENVLQGNLFSNHILLAGIGLVYLVFWSFFSAGLVGVYTSPENDVSLLGVAGTYFFRFVLLTAIAGVIYYLLFNFVLDWFSSLVSSATRETIDERTVFVWVFFKYAVLWLLVWTVNMIFDYAKILTVKYEQKNPFVAILNALRLVFGNIFKTWGLYFLITLIGVVGILIYWLIAPGAGQMSFTSILLTFLISQLIIIFRVALRCLYYASESALTGGLIKVE